MTTTMTPEAAVTPSDPRTDTLPSETAPSAWTWPATTPPDPPARPAPPVTPAGSAPRARLSLRQYLAVSLVAATSAAAVAVPLALADDPPAAATAAPDAVRPIDSGGGTTITAIAEQLMPSVVRIDARSARGAGSGSGVVYRADGYVVTNAHVVGAALAVTVTLPDGTTHEARVLGTDTVSDLAVLQIAATDLPVPAFATDTPPVGSTAVAIGSPFGLDGSVTSGIVSALNRTVTAQGAPLVDLIQTDAAINPGNSGGALANARGELIGLNTVIATSGGGSDGIGFAIPVATIQSVADQLIEDGTVTHAYLGVRGATVDAQTSRMYDLGAEAGALVGVVEPGSPAADAGLRQGDIVTAADGVAITTFPELAARIQRFEVGETVTLTVVRGGREQELVVTLDERPTS